MGSFNTIIITCPRCKREHDKQVKSGDCSLSEYSLAKAPTADLFGLIDETINCPCGVRLTIVLQAIATIDVDPCFTGWEKEDETSSD